MRKPAAFFATALVFGATTLTPGLVRAQDFREEGPIEIDKCQTIGTSGSYKLVRNLSFNSSSGGACLSITASNVTIDLAGFSINVASPTGSAISAVPPSGGTLSGITVRNGTISGSPFFPPPVNIGVDLGSGASIVEGLHVEGMGLLGIGATGIVKGNTVTGTSAPNAFGIAATGLVTGNFVSGNRNGMQIGEARIGGSTVIGNTVVSNSGGLFEGIGISVDCPSNVTDNTAVNNNTNLVLNGNGCNNTNNVAP